VARVGPDDLTSALRGGVARPGRAFSSYRWKMLAYLIRVFAKVKELSRAERAEVVQDSVGFQGLLSGVDDQSVWSQRYALEHVLFPDVSTVVLSRDAAGAAELGGRPADLGGPSSSPLPGRRCSSCRRKEAAALPPGTLPRNTKDARLTASIRRASRPTAASRRPPRSRGGRSMIGTTERDLRRVPMMTPERDSPRPCVCAHADTAWRGRGRGHRAPRSVVVPPSATPATAPRDARSARPRRGKSTSPW
jgi:hypothetical protein